ncbi:Parvulin-like PPIase [uncultured Gammaproteobacteria bacterium]
MMNFDAIVTTVRGETIKVGDVVAHLKLKGLFRPAIYELIERKVICQGLRELNVVIPEAELAKRSRDARMAMGVESPESFARFLSSHGVGEEDWLEQIQAQVARETLKQSLVTTAKIVDYYRKEPHRFTSVSLARVVCRSREEAERVVAESRDNRQDFVELARCFSVDDSTRQSGGFIGNVKHGMLPPEVEQQAFTAADNAVIGPFHENSLWTVYKVYSVNVPKLTDALKNVIRDQIFNEWLREQVCTVPA